MTAASAAPFSGSYHHDDVEFLLTPIDLAPTDLATKERLIQSGQAHYSEMLSPENLPSARYLQVFEQACTLYLQRMAQDCRVLALQIIARRSGPITLVSLARAGTPVGVILRRLLRQMTPHQVCHYSLSIIRDRGIDGVALRHILRRHAAESLLFVDGWTGKGVIARELAASLAAFACSDGVHLDSGLYVLNDLAGCAGCAASHDDYLIPSSILNATVSGLVSRSILNDRIGPDQFHGCVYYPHLAPHDLSRSFVERVVELALSLPTPALPAPSDSRPLAEVSQALLADLRQRHGVHDDNLIKPGIGEATRVLLRRVPRLLLLRQPDAPEVAHLCLLACEKGVPIEHRPDLPYHAVALIRTTQDG